MSSKTQVTYTAAMQKKHGLHWHRAVLGTKDDSNVARLLREEEVMAEMHRLWRDHLETLGEFQVWLKNKNDDHRRRVIHRRAMTRHNAFLDEQLEFEQDEADYLRDWPLDLRVGHQLLESRRKEEEEFRRNGWV
jgi:hypothetical protein